jgi:hypothetical protein
MYTVFEERSTNGSCWVGICGPVRSNQACSIPVNTLIFDHELGSREERIGPFSYFNRVPLSKGTFQCRNGFILHGGQDVGIGV